MRKARGKTLDNIKKAIALFLKSVLHITPFVKKKVITNPNEDFSKPAVIIANHTSFLDTLSLAMVNHKIIYLVNDWVYNSPVFGKLVRALGFYPVSQGIENGMEQLKEKSSRDILWLFFRNLSVLIPMM
ncbi:lysophospholipid acyltransferase family protein [Chryseobacterium indoltheticum]|uniref:lysophospholipid acyltransferase family protein n=1 Tax=Chryseobacterium indoltheticum TaxID=254 RepID=UPI003F490AAC